MQSRANTLVLIATAILLLLAWQAFGTTPKVSPEKWEYMLKAVPDADFDRQLNEYGDQGWELVFARRASSDGEGTTFSYEMIFKRKAGL